ncbi:YceD family protein [Desulforamulus ferrireducens]|uniref:YceD family protein n=1 Tax=Desulforamulus ferrireducens TaxID=1833852 RepID=UPI001EE44C25|nr:DUF177 domain-containing protein [Desulforamulus ferrireducens]
MNFVKYEVTLTVLINILKLKNAPGEKLTFNFSKQVENIEVGGQLLKFVGPVEVTGEIVSRGNHFEVKGETRAKILAVCNNCLEPFELTLAGSLEEVYTRDEDFDVDSEMIGFTGDTLNIEPEVIKSLILELPMRLVCSPECRGLCQQCGANLNITQCNCQHDNIDPRLAVLKQLQQ